MDLPVSPAVTPPVSLPLILFYSALTTNPSLLRRSYLPRPIPMRKIRNPSPLSPPVFSQPPRQRNGLGLLIRRELFQPPPFKQTLIFFHPLPQPSRSPTPLPPRPPHVSDKPRNLHLLHPLLRLHAPRLRHPFRRLDGYPPRLG